MTRIARGRATPPRGPATRRYTGCVPACSAGGGPMNAAGLRSWPTRFPSVRPDDLRPCAVVARSEHGVVARGGLRDDLAHVPVLNDPARDDPARVIEAEDVHPRILQFPGQIWWQCKITW